MTRIVPNITSIVFMYILIQYIGLTRFSVINRLLTQARNYYL